MTRICRGLRPLSKRDAVFETLSSIVPFFRTVWKLERTFFFQSTKKVCDNTEYIQCFHLSAFAWHVKAVNDNFHHLSWFWVRNFVNFSMISREISWNYVELTVNEIHAIELKWKVIPWNAENCFQAWIFCGCEFSDLSLPFIIFFMQNSWQHWAKFPNYFGILKFSEL